MEIQFEFFLVSQFCTFSLDPAILPNQCIEITLAPHFWHCAHNIYSTIIRHFTHSTSLFPFDLTNWPYDKAYYIAIELNYNEAYYIAIELNYNKAYYIAIELNY